MPSAFYIGLDDKIHYHYESRNNVRLRNYHRMDISFTRKQKTKKGRLATWSFSVYNLYARKNPYSYKIAALQLTDNNNGEETAIGLERALVENSFFSILPSINYTINL